MMNNKIKKYISLINLFRTWPTLVLYLLDKDTLKQDLINNSYSSPFSNKVGMLNLNYILTWKKEFRNIAYYRYKRHYALNGISKLLLHAVESLEIGGEIGPGLMIFHGNGSVIEPYKIGENCMIWQQVTIGRRPRHGEIIDKPTIGNNVKVYAGAIIIGNISIGNNVSVGAGAVVVKDVADGCTVIGNPARILANK